VSFSGEGAIPPYRLGSVIELLPRFYRGLRRLDRAEKRRAKMSEQQPGEHDVKKTSFAPGTDPPKEKKDPRIFDRRIAPPSKTKDQRRTSITPMDVVHPEIVTKAQAIAHGVRYV
jgi:hypothetical protein